MAKDVAPGPFHVAYPDLLTDEKRDNKVFRILQEELPDEIFAEGTMGELEFPDGIEGVTALNYVSSLFRNSPQSQVIKCSCKYNEILV